MQFWKDSGADMDVHNYEYSWQSEHSQPAVAAAGDHVANFSPGIQVRVVDFHRVHRHWGREVPAGGPAPDGVQQPIDR